MILNFILYGYIVPLIWAIIIGQVVIYFDSEYRSWEIGKKIGIHLHYFVISFIPVAAPVALTLIAGIDLREHYKRRHNDDGENFDNYRTFRESEEAELAKNIGIKIVKNEKINPITDRLEILDL